ncbi:hypothetical protein F5X68DRAFT_248936 [Plectosphaerella plurivora]|uniref:T6SS Phospholipase effector Tle1-like catalytic domain-containing protein n=1 Tax=Plectosphaerella plurivora TaxID=936078 RepID=A0A9P8V137_9PEZI|nr:hypothetical protein F5X68DRAFT_248936 [Plectosphaerella plurivora]
MCVSKPKGAAADGILRLPPLVMPTRKLVLCFDGTGNKFHGDESDSNILKIFRLLDSSASDQSGIGTYVVSENISHTGLRAKAGAWYQMAKDSAVGSSFDQHVVGGYRFLMRYYNPGDEIYMFGFSRGAYVARFLAEMLDHVGLLAHGNEEMVLFAWNAFSQWQTRKCHSTPEGKVKRDEMYKFLKGFRETFSRPIRRIRFLGLFDTVNSVPRFETAWMQRSKFPYTARSSAKVIRHAVSIDERRAKFRQDLIYQESPRKKKDQAHALMEKNPLGDLLHSHTKYRAPRRTTLAPEQARQTDNRGRQQSRGEDEGRPEPYRFRSRSRSRATRATDRSGGGPSDACSVNPAVDVGYDSDEGEQDMDEVWFAGSHADIGGGWSVTDERKNASHIPLVWMVREAMRAGLSFDPDQLEELGCVECSETYNPFAQLRDDGPEVPQILVDAPSPPTSPAQETTEKLGQPEQTEKRPSGFQEMLQKAELADIHDSLAFGGGLPHLSVAMWRFMEFMPFRRLDLRPDGTWKPIRWPLPRGETRDIPHNVRIHGSVIRRMQQDKNYRPGNLIVGGGGRGMRKAPEEHGIGEWMCVAGNGDMVDEIWTRRRKSQTDES